jgi:type II secretory ATPase GspE/PulE/Tfp pilus assembly ATPase PilB-like protein
MTDSRATRAFKQTAIKVIDDLERLHKIPAELCEHVRSKLGTLEPRDFVTHLVSEGVNPDDLARAIGATMRMEVYSRSGAKGFGTLTQRTSDYILYEGGQLFMTNPLDTESYQKTVRHLNGSVSGVGVLSLKDMRGFAVDVREAKIGPEDSASQEFVRRLVHNAQTQGVSDIHICPRGEKVEIKFRIDGRLRTQETIPVERYDPIAGSIMTLCSKNAGEYLHPFDGRFEQVVGGQSLQLRMAGIETIKGGYSKPKFTLRLLTNNIDLLDMDQLGFREETSNPQKRMITEALRSPYGMIIVTGPTGSGKSTTLFSMMRWLYKRDPTSAYYTLEDPVEAELPFADQIQCGKVRTFASGLRNLLRQDPDVILLGEMRDGETAKIAVEAAITGHRMFSTLHANNALLAASRLRMTITDADADPRTLGDALLLVTAQRIIQRPCEHCSIYIPWAQAIACDHPVFSGDAAVALRERYRDAPLRYSSLIHAAKPTDLIRVVKPGGCEHCGQTGTRGRAMVAEVLPVVDSVKQIVAEGGSEAELRREAIKHGYKPMWEHAMQLIREGRLSLDTVESASGLGPLPLQEQLEQAA